MIDKEVLDLVSDIYVFIFTIAVLIFLGWLIGYITKTAGNFFYGVASGMLVTIIVFFIIVNDRIKVILRG